MGKRKRTRLVPLVVPPVPPPKRVGIFRRTISAAGRYSLKTGKWMVRHWKVSLSDITAEWKGLVMRFRLDPHSLSLDQEQSFLSGPSIALDPSQELGPAMLPKRVRLLLFLWGNVHQVGVAEPQQK